MRDLDGQGGARPKTSRKPELHSERGYRRRAMSAERRPETEFLGTQGVSSRPEREERGTARADPRMPGRLETDTERQTSDKTVREAVESYMDALSRNTAERCKMPPVDPPRYQVGGDWRCFLAEFKEMVQMADLKPSHQLAFSNGPFQRKQKECSTNIKLFFGKQCRC